MNTNCILSNICNESVTTYHHQLSCYVDYMYVHRLNYIFVSQTLAFGDTFSAESFNVDVWCDHSGN